jgi:lipoyl(octanoyl) transferase
VRRCAVYPFELADGPTNMARDEWMIEQVEADPSIAQFRSYGWIEPTLSLGYFQAIGEVQRDVRWRDVPVVRRATGGGAIWHDLEWTYALAISTSHPNARRAPELYQAVHGAIAERVSASGFQAQRRGQADALARTNRPFLCFLDRDANDVVVNGLKILGSAQRRRRDVLLQHGSLLLCSSPMTPELPGLADLGASQVLTESKSLGLDLVERILAALELEALSPYIPLRENARISTLRTTYESASWTRRR